MSTVLLIAMQFYNYNDAIKNYFEKKGYNVVIYDNPEINYNIKEKIDNKIVNLLGKSSGAKKDRPYPVREIKKKSDEIYRIYKEVHPEIVIILKGDIISKELIRKMNSSVNILWMMDSFSRFEFLIPQADMYDKVYVFEYSDIQLLAASGIEAEYLPLCADERIYFKQKADKNIDILFVGSIYKQRKRLLDEILKRYPKLNIEIYGYNIMKSEIIKKILYRRGLINRKYKKPITPEEINEKYSRTKICINIHHSQTIYGANMRVFESLAAGCFQLVDSNPYIEETFSGGLVTYKNKEDMFAKLDYYLKNVFERETIAKRGYECVIKKHLFANRLDVILEAVNEVLKDGKKSN